MIKGVKLSGFLVMFEIIFLNLISHSKANHFSGRSNKLQQCRCMLLQVRLPEDGY